MIDTMNYSESQLQSPLFRLPRELRDHIYDQYVSPNANWFDFRVGTLRGNAQHDGALERPRHFHLGLMYICKRVASELCDITKITFFPGPSINNYQGSSRAGTFRCLLRYVQMAKIHILERVRDLVTSDMIVHLTRLYPGIGQEFGLPLHCAGFGEFAQCRQADEEDTEPIDDSIHYALDVCMKKDPALFLELAAEALKNRWVVLSRPFDEQSLLPLLAWRPKSWIIPRDSDLEFVERLLNKPLSELELVAHGRATKWLFSATAVAITTLNQLPRGDVLWNKRIVLKEDRRSVSAPELHMRGMIPICTKYPHLRIERRISFWTNMLPTGWVGVDDRPEPIFHPELFVDLPFEWFLRTVPTWLDEIAALEALGMPSNCLTVVIEAPCDKSQELWDMLKRAAALQDAMNIWSRRNQVKIPLQHTFSSQLMRRQLLARLFLYPLPCYVLPSFSQVMKDIIHGTSPVRFAGTVGDHWDADALATERQNWSLFDWNGEWSRDIALHCFSPPQEWWDELRDSYRLDQALDVFPSAEPGPEGPS